VGRPDADSAARFGQELIHAGRAIEALAVVHGVWQTHPGHRDIALVRARALMALNRPALAITLLDRLLAADPDDDEALCLRQVCGPHRA
jgi:predicted Zn-dependent protease